MLFRLAWLAKAYQHDYLLKFYHGGLQIHLIQVLAIIAVIGTYNGPERLKGRKFCINHTHAMSSTTNHAMSRLHHRRRAKKPTAKHPTAASAMVALG